MVIKKVLLKKLVIAIAICMSAGSVQAQTAPRAYYVHANGDDQNNNGRSESAPFKSLEKAVEMASAGAVKTIIVMGSFGSLEISNTGSAEILISGKADATEAEKASLTGIRVNGNSKIRLEYIVISGNRNRGIYIFGASVTIGKGVLVTGNNGGVYVGYKGTFIMTDGKICNNSDRADRHSVGFQNFGIRDLKDYSGGGGVFVDGTTDDPSNDYGRISNNGTFSMSGGEISENTTKGYNGTRGGGGVCVGGGYSYDGGQGGVFVMSGGKISGNSGSVSHGAGVYVDSSDDSRGKKGTFTMTGGEIIENNGDGVYSKGHFTMSNGKINGNKKDGVCGDNGSVFTMSNGEINGNDGYGASVGSITVSGGEISGNKNTGVYAATFTFKNGKITNNIGKNGGGVYTAELDMSNGEISGNKGEYGGGVYVSGEFIFSGGKITGNEAEFVGGGIYIKNGATYTAKGGVVTANKAGDGEGEDIFKQ
jgi:hypothetical protein